MKRAVILLSGGLDSTTCLYWAKDQGYLLHALIVNYGQRHSKEVKIAKNLAEELGIDHCIVRSTLPWGGSALIDPEVDIPKERGLSEMASEIPVTYVPARNTLFLSYALSWAETLGADAIVIGANQIDWSGYPDCRPEFYQAFRQVIQTGTKMGVENKKIEILTPLINKTKKEIIQLGAGLGVPFEKTWSCYAGLESPCGECDSCQLREKGFKEAKISYATST